MPASPAPRRGRPTLPRGKKTRARVVKRSGVCVWGGRGHIACSQAPHTGRRCFSASPPFVSASITPDRSRYLLNSSFLVSGLCDANERAEARVLPTSGQQGIGDLKGRTVEHYRTRPSRTATPALCWQGGKLRIVRRCRNRRSINHSLKDHNPLDPLLCTLSPTRTDAPSYCDSA